MGGGSWEERERYWDWGWKKVWDGVDRFLEE